MLYRIRKPDAKKLAFVKRGANGNTWHLFKGAPSSSPATVARGLLMAEREYSDQERELAVRAAEEHGDQRVAEIMKCSAATIRSWRHRAQRKTVDKRARDATETAPTTEVVDIMLRDGGWDSARGCESKIPARGRVIRNFKLAAELVSMAPMRHMGVAATEAAGLAAGHIVLLGDEKFASFGDAVWEVVSRSGRWRDQYPYTPTLPRRLTRPPGASISGRPPRTPICWPTSCY